MTPILHHSVILWDDCESGMKMGRIREEEEAKWIGKAVL